MNKLSLISLAIVLQACGEDGEQFYAPKLINEVELNNGYGARYPSVIKDPSTGIYRAYHLVEITSPTKELHYAESNDGIHFIPKGKVFSYPDNLYGAEVSFDTHTSRYVLAFHSNPGRADGALIDYSKWNSQFAYSDDGLNFTVDESSSFRPSTTVSDAPALPIWNDSLKTYSMMIRPALGDRSVSQVESSDLKNWSEPKPVFTKNINGAFQTQYYGMPVFKVENTWVAFVLIMKTPSEKANQPTGKYETFIARSSDGINWDLDESAPLVGMQQGNPFELNSELNVYGSGGVEATSLVEMPDGSFNIYASGFLVDHSLLVKQRLAGTPATRLLVYNVSKSFLLKQKSETYHAN